MYKSLKFRIEGVTPLLMHNGDLSNPMNPVVRLMREITGKRKKTDEDIELLAKLEWIGGLYLTEKPRIDLEGYNIAIDGKGKPCIPDSVLESALIAGAKKFKLGVQAKAGIRINGDFPIKFGESKTLSELFCDPSYMDTRRVKVQQSAIMRTRPIFKDWSVDFELEFLPDVLNPNQVKEILETTGKIVGLGDYRPKYGQFAIA